MKQIAYAVDLKDDPEVIRRYEEYHAAIWPEVAQSLKAVGMKQVNIWRLGRRLFMLITADDDFDPVEASAKHRASHPRVREWEELMASFQQRVPGIEGDGTWAEMNRVFELR
jgi:L-rhamnose mutarotase